MLVTLSVLCIVGLSPAQPATIGWSGCWSNWGAIYYSSGMCWLCYGKTRMERQPGTTNRGCDLHRFWWLPQHVHCEIWGQQSVMAHWLVVCSFSLQNAEAAREARRLLEFTREVVHVQRDLAGWSLWLDKENVWLCSTKNCCLLLVLSGLAPHSSMLLVCVCVCAA